MEKLIKTNLVFLIKRRREEITDICLAMKKRGFGAGKWNGVGGKIKPEETIEESARRETKEEIFVSLGNLKKVGELSFSFPHENERVIMHVYFSEEWEGEPKESEEMKPRWFSVDSLPYEKMWDDDPFWIPKVLQGNLIKAEFEFDKDDLVTKHQVDVVDKF